MDKIIFRQLTVFLLILVASYSYGQSIYKDKYVKVVYNKNWTMDSLQAIQKKVKTKYNIDVEFKNVTLDKQEKVKTFLLIADDNVGYSGEAIYNGEKEGRSFGFFINYKKFVMTNFAIGYLKD